MEFPTDLKYTKNDEWVRVEGNIATVGITDYAQDQRNPPKNQETPDYFCLDRTYILCY